MSLHRAGPGPSRNAAVPPYAADFYTGDGQRPHLHPMTARVSPAESVLAEVDELFAPEGDLGEVLELVALLGAPLLPQTRVRDRGKGATQN